MYLDKFAEGILALMVSFNQTAGSSTYSFELVPACGTNEAQAACSLAPRCAQQTWQCAPPRWSPSRAGWVVPESKEVAYRRYKGIAESVSRVAFMAARCKDELGIVVESCRPVGWPEGPESLAAVGAITALYESGLREDIQFGYPPMGRGPDGEVCLVQAMPSQIAQFATWIPAGEKKAYERMNNVQKRVQEEAWAAQMLGDSKDALDKCFSVGLKMLSHARSACRGNNWAYGMWSMYGTGTTCAASAPPSAQPAVLGKKQPKSFAQERADTYHRMRSHPPTLPPEVRTILGMGPAPAPATIGAGHSTAASAP